MAKRKARDYKKVKFTVGKDPLDLRDLYYEGNLDELRPWVNNCGDIPFILDQGNEGACTGFGLAAMVNFLQHNKAGARPLGESDGASARMLYPRPPHAQTTYTARIMARCWRMCCVPWVC